VSEKKFIVFQSILNDHRRPSQSSSSRGHSPAGTAKAMVNRIFTCPALSGAPSSSAEETIWKLGDESTVSIVKKDKSIKKKAQVQIDALLMPVASEWIHWFSLSLLEKVSPVKSYVEKKYWSTTI
jgi:hypothetical protein